MAKYLIMPKMGFNMEEGTLEMWHFKEGDAVKKGDVIADIETDKTVVGYESELGGILLKLLVEEGTTVPVVTPIAIIGEAGEDISQLLKDARGAAVGLNTSAQTESEALAAAYAQESPSPAPKADAQLKLTPRARKYISEHNIDISLIDIQGTGFQGGLTEKDIQRFVAANKISITPLAKKIAEDLGVDVSGVQGSGVQGKIMRADIALTAAVSARGSEIPTEMPYSGMRKLIGDRLSQSKFTAPHVYFTLSVDMGSLLDLREQINQTGDVKISVNDFVLCAVAQALQKHPEINSSLRGDKILQFREVNLGMAVALDRGLIVPVIRNTENLKLGQIASKTKELIAKAKEGRLMPDDYQGGTFTVSNLGMIGIENFTAIINPPEAGILSVSAIKWTPVAEENTKDSRIVLRPMMNMTVSVDHRIIDGIVATRFITEVKSLLEKPFCILL